MQCHNLPSAPITTLGFRNLLIHPTDYDIISLVKVLHTTHVPSNVSLGISLSPAIYSPQCPLTKSYQYLSRFLLFNTIHDYLDKLKLTTLSQGSIYSRASTICPCTIIHLTNKHTPSIYELCLEFRRKVPYRKDNASHTFPKGNLTTVSTNPLPLYTTPCKFCILFTLLHQNTKAIRWKIVMNTPRSQPPPQHHLLLTTPKGTSTILSHAILASESPFYPSPLLKYPQPIPSTSISLTQHIT